MKSFFFFLSLSDVYPGLILKSGAARRIAIAYNRMCARWGVRKSGENVYQHGTWPNRAIPNRHRVCVFFNWSADWRWRHAGLLSLSSPPSPAHKVSEPPGDSVLSLPDMPLQPWKEFPSCPASRKVSLEPCFSQLFLNPWAPCRWTRLLVKTLLCGLYD